jgi:hypothetical protein
MALVDRSHLVTGDRVADLLDGAVTPLGLRAEAFVVDLGQRVLRAVRPGSGERHEVEGTLAGRAYQHGVIVAHAGDGAGRTLWIPMLDGTERVGVLRVELDAGVIDDEELRRRCTSAAGLVAHIAMTKLAYSDWLRRLRADRPLTMASELLWQLVPPRTFATDRIAVTALLEPFHRVGGDAYDYAVDADTADLAVYDGVGHDLDAGLATTLAMTAVRNARRGGDDGLVAMADRADRMLRARVGVSRHRFVTAVLARLDIRTGVLDVLLAGHPRPLLVRDGHMVKELGATVRGPLGVPTTQPAEMLVAREQLEPGDRLLFYSDGILEARDPHGDFFGMERLVTFIERTESDQLPAPETLRRLRESFFAHLDGALQDDATLLMVEWEGPSRRSMFPSTDPGEGPPTAGPPAGRISPAG